MNQWFIMKIKLKKQIKFNSFFILFFINNIILCYIIKNNKKNYLQIFKLILI